MFEARRYKSTPALMFSMLELSVVWAARKVRSGHRNALAAIAINLMQVALFMAIFYLMFSVLELRSATIRGNFMLYLLTGIFLYLTHIKAVSAIMGAENSTSAMMQHGPMNTMVAILSSAISVLYQQLISVLIILVVIHTLMEPIRLDDWGGSALLFLLAWFLGCCVGLVFMALKPWFPTAVTIMQTLYIRVNMIASGKMFVANMLPSMMVALFDWNPLFHIIDQLRGNVFVNYNPNYSNWEYPLYIALALLLLGMMGEFYTRKHASLSWGAAQ